MNRKYDPVLKRIPPRAGCPEIVFRQAGDGFLEVVYGNNEASANKTIRDIILRSLRVIIMNGRIREYKISGLLETVPGTEALLYRFDPTVISVDRLIGEISTAEIALPDVYGQRIKCRALSLPLAFDHSLIRQAIEKYVREVNPDAFYCQSGSNLEYIAAYNGLSVAEVKQKFLNTRWLTSMVGFFPGLPFCYPLNPASALTCPKYNPARTWTPEGAVDLADYCMTIFGVESSGGCQLIGRTVPIFRAKPSHPAFRECPALIRPTDMIQYYESSEEEIDDIYQLVDQGQWTYRTQEQIFAVDEWLSSYDNQEKEIKELQIRQEQARKKVRQI